VDDPRGWVLYDLGTGGSTRANGMPVDRHVLKEGDEIRLGETRLVFETGTRRVDASEGRVVISESISPEIFESVSVKDAKTDRSSRKDLALHDRFQKICHISSVIGLKLDLERILEEALGCFFDVFPGVERGVILLVDSATQKLAPRMFKKRNERVEDRISVPRTVLDHVVGQSQAVVSADAMTDERFAMGTSIQFQKVRFMMCAPMICQDEILGAIYLDSSAHGRFTGDDLLLLNGIGGQVAVAIKNAQMNRSLREKEQLERELAIARTIQQSLLPRRLPVPPGWELAADSEPARRVGGDFYDAVLTKDGALVLVVGDVSGKGIAAALYMAGVLSELRFLLGSTDDIETAVGLANDGLVARETMGMFVTALVVHVDPRTGRGRYVTAGHPEPILVRAGGRVERLESPGGGPPLGIRAGVGFEASAFELAPGESLFLCTDGVYEARSPSGECYGFDRVEELLGAGAQGAAEILRRTVDAVGAFSGPQGRGDDLTLLVARRAAAE
ncbi:MAG: SpoIIE family protein phosphatase, partial [Planctomycetes bacterium]|nr:SpoIIE family protein phosphatase [Planctomycetota bacterium]